MHPTLVTITALLLSSFSFTIAIDSLNAPSSVKAGTDFEVSVNNNPGKLGSSDAHFTEYRVYLAITPPGNIEWGSEPVCYLVNSSDISITDFIVQIPASVGPSGTGLYSIATQEFNARGDSSDMAYSNTFSFIGGTGKLTQYELEGNIVNDPDSTPCSAYDCTKQCSQKFYPETINATTIEDYQNTYKCWVACPGTTYKSWDYQVEQYWGYRNASAGSDDGGSETSTSSSKSASATKSVTTTTKSKPTGSASTTSTLASASGLSTSTSTTSGSTPSQTKSASSKIGVDFSVISATLFGFAALLYTL